MLGYGIYALRKNRQSQLKRGGAPGGMAGPEPQELGERPVQANNG